VCAKHSAPAPCHLADKAPFAAPMDSWSALAVFASAAILALVSRMTSSLTATVSTITPHSHHNLP
ncbi:MAG: hypothetical protein LBS58_03940, partial [Coriobacteriales bacterium]|nr:hypothetical protein [Coriobacteriales bacterium]